MWRRATWRRSRAARPFAVVLQYPEPPARCATLSPEIAAAHDADALAIVAADLLSLAILKPPGEMGADMVVGSAQRFGVPMGFGGPHAGYFATRDAFKRHMPGRLVGVSVDGRRAGAAAGAADARAAHPAREGDVQHLHLAGAAGGDRRLLCRVARPGGFEAHRPPRQSAARGCWPMPRGRRHRVRHDAFFDTIVVECDDADALLRTALGAGFNLRRVDDGAVGIALDETVTREELALLAWVLGRDLAGAAPGIPAALARNTCFLEQSAFEQHHSEHAMLRYLKRLEDKDIALNRSMIPLGSCTMKLNATAEMIPISWPGFAGSTRSRRRSRPRVTRS